MLLNNTLKNNQNWSVTKLELEMNVMGAESFFEQTQPLNGDFLNLGSWHGFQEIISLNRFDYDQLRFKTKLNKDAYLIFYYQIQDNEKLAIKIANQPNQSACLQIRNDGYFINQKLLENLSLNENRWTDVKASVHQNEIEFDIEGKKVACPINGYPNSKIGFKNGLENSYLDDIIVSKNKDEIFSENFSNQKRFNYYLSLLFAAIIVINFANLIGKKGESRKRSLMLQVLINISLLMILIISFFYLLLFYVGNYPNLNSTLLNLKSAERNWARDEVKFISKFVMEEGETKGEGKMMFIGSSQTWGAGATNHNNRFSSLVEQELKKQLEASNSSATNTAKVLGYSTADQISVINAGAAGSTSTELLEEYSGRWIDLKPKTVFINLSSNDYDYKNNPTIFERNLETFINVNKEAGINTIFLLEARSPENKDLNQFHQIVIDVSKRHGVPLINIYEYLKNNDSKGLIWWDFVHPTDFGHRLIANYIIEELNKINSLQNQKSLQTSQQNSSPSAQTN